MNPDPTELTTELTADPTAETVLDQTLVEEVSIDGMCGVY